MRTSRVALSVAVPVLAVLLAACGGGDPDNGATDEPSTSSSSSASPSAEPSGSGTPAPVRKLAPEPCATKPDVTVGTADELQDALDEAGPGDAIRVQDGTYEGEFEISESGTAAEPAELCGTAKAVLSGGPSDGGYTLHLDGADHWRILGITLQGGQKGLMADGTTGSLVDGITVKDTGDEAIHLRANSTDNIVQRATVRNTGLREEKFGEGIYIGTAESNWGDISNGKPDRSDRNVIRNNDIAQTTAESVDIKEGTTGGTLKDNTFSGVGMTEGDSWVDVKGNEWTIDGNRGDQAPEDGYKVLQILDGWGRQNVFTNNVSVVGGDGYGINVTKQRDGNIVECSNVARDAGEGLTTIDCT
jgi:hypothetical protein